MIPDSQFYPQLIALRESALRELPDSRGASEASDKTWFIAKVDEAIKTCCPPVPGNTE
jgi:hypothetical protein